MGYIHETVVFKLVVVHLYCCYCHHYIHHFFLSIVAIVLFRGTNLRVQLSFSPTKQYVLAELASVKIGGFFDIYVTAYFID